MEKLVTDDADRVGEAEEEEEEEVEERVKKKWEGNYNTDMV